MKAPLPYLICFGLLVALAGCGAKPEGTAIQGHVTFKDQPVAKGSLAFFPATGRPTIVATDELGAYQATLSPGAYTVTVTLGVTLPPGWKESDPLPKPALTLPVEYSIKSRTKLNATVAETSSGPLDFKLE